MGTRTAGIVRHVARRAIPAGRAGRKSGDRKESVAWYVCEEEKIPTATGQPGVLVGVDGTPALSRAVDWAARDAVKRHVGLTIVHAVTPIDITLPIAVLLPTGLSRWQLERGQQVPLSTGLR